TSLKLYLAQLFKNPNNDESADENDPPATDEQHQSGQLQPQQLAQPPPSQQKASEIGLRAVMADWDGFQLFMQHVTLEFSMVCLLLVFFSSICCYENVLAIVELTQFQQYYHFDRVNTGDDTTPDDVFIELPLEKIPNSAIVYDKVLNIQQKCCRLCEKYVLLGGDHELNISFRVRQELTTNYHEHFSSKTVTQCAFVFDKVVQEISSLVSDSFWRFRDTHNFQEWVFKKYSS
ncbi:hypothetical protein RFI_29174, partial [Reticulomyxa filosa]